MVQIYKGATGKAVAAECGFHAEIVSDGARAVFSLLDLKAKTWSMAIIDPAKDLGSNAACESYAIRAVRQPEVLETVTEDSNEEYYERCLALEDELKSVAVRELDVDEEPDDDDNSYL